MKAAHLTSHIIFCAFSIFCATSQPNATCPAGWFGSNCQYKCRCTNNCDNYGLCLGSDTCMAGWFGPACQYADLAYGSQSVPELTDGKDDTCLNDVNTFNSVTIMLNEPYTFTWLRVRSNKMDSLGGIQVTFDNSIICNNPRNATVDSRTLDIYCSLDVFVTSVTLAGTGISSSCSVYISGGRNIAVKESAKQSSTYSQQLQNQLVSFVANLSVDGNTNQYFFRGLSCSCTNAEAQSPDQWNLTLSQVRSVNRYVIYSRTDGSIHRLQNFLLESFAGAARVYQYKEQPKSSQVYTVRHSDLNISFVQLTSGSTDKVLQMCEMEIYGDSVCEEGKYGRDCENTCNCGGSQPCLTSTGGCPSGCAAGYQGENCWIPCSPGKYGPGCQTECSQFCVKDTTNISVCDRVTGACALGCEDGYQGSNCALSCEEDKYGKACNQTCSHHCANRTMDETSCHHVHGACHHGCHGGFQEPSCHSPCDRGRYGPGCIANCSSLCMESNATNLSPCHHVTGVCLFGCQGGYDDLICKQVSEAISPAGSDNGELIGIIVGCVTGLIVLSVIIATVVWISRRRRRSRADTNSNPRAAGTGSNCSLTSNVAGGKQTPTGKTIDKSGAEGKMEDNPNSPARYYNSSTSVPVSTAVSIDDLAGFIISKDKDFFKNQFGAIQDNEKATMSVGLSSENKHKNRYKNVCAYDHSRVHLKPNPGKKQGDYINASYIQGYKPDEKFIASQGPTKTILEDFVRMLWEQAVDRVVMLTNLVEEGKLKCERYWPEDGEMKVGEITVSLTTTQVFADYTIHRLQLKKDGSPNQELIHFHFTSWPDKDIPNTPWGLVDFEQRVASYPTNRPIVVHCSAGVGRTGTFIALRNVMREAEETGQVDFLSTVRKLRQNRVNMIQTVDQYIFLHKAALVAMLCVGTTITSTDIDRRIEVLETKLQSGQTKMEAEFKSVCSACDDKDEEKASEDNPYNVYENSQVATHKQKNRVQSILPKEMYRAKLRCENNEVADYINAVLVPSFSKQNQQILTQLPLPETVTDFWRLVTQYKVTAIVAFQTDLSSTDPTIADYLPVGGTESINLPMFKISTKPGKTAMFWREQEVSVTIDTEMMQKFSVVTTEHHLTHLTCSTSDLDTETLLAITQHARSLQPVGNGRLLYMCRNGAEYSGLVCVLSLLLDRMDNDHHLTVPLVVGAIKAIRPQVIPTLDQYRLLYKALHLYSESFNEYSNFGSSTSLQ